jgi:hypothetical protein
MGYFARRLAPAKLTSDVCRSVCVVRKVGFRIFSLQCGEEDERPKSLYARARSLVGLR